MPSVFERVILLYNLLNFGIPKYSITLTSFFIVYSTMRRWGGFVCSLLIFLIIGVNIEGIIKNFFIQFVCTFRKENKWFIKICPKTIRAVFPFFIIKEMSFTKNTTQPYSPTSSNNKKINLLKNYAKWSKKTTHFLWAIKSFINGKVS